MKCNDVMALLDPLIDGELAKDVQTSVTAHIDECLGCKAEFDEMCELQNDLEKATSFSAPEALRANIQQKINEENIVTHSFWLSIKSLLTLICNPVSTHTGAALCGALLVTLIIQQPFKTNTLQSETFNTHINSLISNNFIAIKSNDQHTVKPWFAGKIKFSPPTPDLKNKGFFLLGGRVDDLQDKKVAVLLYLRDKHKISVFISPITSKSILKNKQWHSNGYNGVFWRDKTFTYSAISDLSPLGLENFSREFATNTNKILPDQGSESSY